MARQKFQVVVTGGAGFIGSHVVERFLRAGAAVTVVDDLSTGLPKNLGHVKERITFVREGVASPRSLKACAAADAIIHLQALVSVPASVEHPAEAHQRNVEGFVQLLESVRSKRCRVVFASSAAVYGNDAPVPTSENAPLRPFSPYALHKIVGEQYLSLYSKLYGFEHAILRFFNVYGPRQRADSPYSGVISLFMAKASRGEPLTIFGDGSFTRDFVHVSDVAEACYLAATKKGISGLVCNVGGGTRTTIGELARVINEICGSQLPVRYEKTRVGDIAHSRASIRRIKKALGWSPTITLKAGLSELARVAPRR